MCTRRRCRRPCARGPKARRASSIELRSAFRAVHEVGGFLDAPAWKRVADVAAKGDAEGVWRQATVAAIVLRDPSLAVDASAWRATCRDGALLLDDGGPVPEYLATVASAACLFPSEE